MVRLTQLAHLAAALAIAAFFASLTWTLWQRPHLIAHIDGVLTRAEGVESKLNATASNLDRATGAWADSAKAQAAAIQDVTLAMQGTMSSVDLTLASVRSNSDALNGEIGALHKTTDAATGSLKALTETVQTANGTIAAGKPLLEAYTRSGNDLDALLKDDAIHRTLNYTADTMGDFHAITFDFARVTHAETERFLKPVPWWKWPLARAGQFIDIGAAVARNMP
jgi:hypothetical protein